MSRVLVLQSDYREGISKKNQKPYAGYFAEVAYLDEQGNGFKYENLFLDSSVLNGFVPERGCVIDVITGLRSSFINAVRAVNDTSMLSQYIASLQALLAKNSGK